MLETAATDPYTSCGLRKMICISHLEQFLIHHMSNRYSGQMGLLLSPFEEQLETFRQRAVPEPAAALREGAELANDARLDVPSTVICTSFSSEQIKDAVEKGYAWVGGLAELRDITYVDLPTSHWPMWSRPEELAAVIGDVARGASAG